LTAQNYKELEELYVKYNAEKKFTVLGFPCNQFGSQEPGTPQEIQAFAKSLGATFPLTEKVDVNGDDAHPLWKYLKVKLPGVLGTEGIKWNFSKFLIDRNGVPVERFGPRDNPLSFENKIQEELAKAAGEQKCPAC